MLLFTIILLIAFTAVWVWAMVAWRAYVKEGRRTTRPLK